MLRRQSLAVIIRFSGDPDELFGRFEQARRMWIEAETADYERPVFYATCRADDGIAIITVWRNAVAHRAFGQGLHAHINAVGLRAPDRIERMRIEDLGWSEPGARPA